ncbi:hypothetical protein DSM112329_01472 [Paraconexibacter sp. AEG42_29]|uniref:Uncharacterized protein n=1 Tax=Paraconexibacter sp. AEG42_29 TaxID=2997339 RepID=A0AAU7ASL7_9ACTN
MPHTPSTRGPRTAALVLAVAGTAAAIGVPTLAGAAQPRHVGGPGTGASITTAGPDLRTITLDPANSLEDTIGERARYCFDQPIAKIGTGGFVLQSYDVRRYWQGTATQATDNAACAVVSFPAGSDIGQATIGGVGPGAVTDLANKPSLVASEPVIGSAAKPAGGATTAPDLIDATADISAGNAKIVTYTFDESLNPAPSRGAGEAAQTAYQASDFGYVLQDGDPVYAAAGKVTATGNQVKVNFGAAPVESAARFVTKQNAVEDRPASAVQPGSGLPLVTRSAPGVVAKSAQTGGRPSLVAAAPDVANSFKLTFSGPVTGGSAAQIRAIADDGTLSAVASSIGTGGSENAIIATFPDSDALTKDPGSIVRIVAGAGAVTTTTDPKAGSIYSQAPVSTPNNTPGYTNGPDLLNVAVDAATQRATFNYDEPVAASTPPSRFTAFRSDGTDAQGTGTTTSSGNSITVTLGAGIADFVAFGQGYGAVNDVAGRPSPNQSVSKDVEAAPTPPAPAPSAGKTKVKTSLSLRRSGSRFSGTISAAQKTCKYNRTMVLRKKGKSTTRYGTARSLSTGRYGITKRNASKGTYYVFVLAKSTKTISCSSATSKQSVRVR